MSLNFYIDAPESFTLASRYLQMRGWGYHREKQLRGVRIVLASLVLSGRFGTFRPDVPKVFPEAPDDYTGFEVWAILPVGRNRASLEFQDDQGHWHEATTLQIAVPKWRIPPWLPGTNTTDLVLFQLGARPSYAPRKIVPERFPQARMPRKSHPPIAVVTPSFNQCHYLGETISSVLEQKDVDLEYAVQDGGSSDGSKALIERVAAETGNRRLETGGLSIVEGGWKPVNGTSSIAPAPVVHRLGEGRSRLVAWASEPDAGQADAIARGFAKTSGGPDDLMSWINSDDIYLPGALAFAADYFSRHPEVDAIYGHRILIDEDSREIGRWFLPPHTNEMLRLNDYVPQETLFWRRRIWDKVGGLDPSFKFAMDWDLLLRFQEAGARIVRVPYFLACFRVHAGQKTSAQMESIGMKEIDLLRLRTYGRKFSPAEVMNNPLFIHFMRKSAWIEFLWTLGIRAA